MRCLLFTLNFKEKMCANARESLLDASKRWGFDFLEIHSELRTGYYASYQKLFALAENMAYEFVMYVDADMLIRSDTPNPATVFGPGVWMVPDCQMPYTEAEKADVREGVHNRWYDDVIRMFNDYPIVPRETFLECPHNAGMIIVNGGARHYEAFRLAAARVPAPTTDLAWAGHFEQAMVNYALLLCGGAQSAAETWNRICPDESGAMKDYVYHFTGCGYIDTRRKKIATFSWRV